MHLGTTRERKNKGKKTVEQDPEYSEQKKRGRYHITHATK
jgi:hypothetical protein